MHILYLSDRLSLRGGADQHLLQVIGSVSEGGARISVACGRWEAGVELPPKIQPVRKRGLAVTDASPAGLDGLDRMLASADVVHIQNVMNPEVLRTAAATGRAVVTVQDHRVFCPAMGKTLPDGRRCTRSMDDAVCTPCLPDAVYRSRILGLTQARRDALEGARLIALSRYMAAELEAVGLPGAEVIPPWVELGIEEPSDGTAFLLAGRMVAHKGVRDAWQAWRISGVAQPLRVAGAGPLEVELEGAELLGWLPSAALRGELRGARALLFPSFWQEPFGILGLEALAEATPVIIADTGGASDWSDAGCIRVPAGDADAMAEAMVRLARDPQEATRLGREGRAAVAERFSRAVIEPRLRAVYGKLRE